MNKVEIFNSEETLAEETAKQFQKILMQSLKTDNNFFAALSGGNTPRILFRKLADSPYKEKIDWNRIHFFWADERMVPPGDPESNYGEAKKILFDNISIPAGNIHRIKGEDDPKQEVLRYAAEIEEYIKKDQKGFPRFNLIFLGIGEDGHTASLFPGKTLQFTDEKNLCGLSKHPASSQLRISLTKETINNAEKIIFLVTGESKAETLAGILKNSSESKNFPGAQIKPINGSIKWKIDKKASKFL
jgi:6-phosphogluconolactonase